MSSPNAKLFYGVIIIWILILIVILGSVPPDASSTTNYLWEDKEDEDSRNE